MFKFSKLSERNQIIICTLFFVILGTTSGILIKRNVGNKVIDYTNINIDDFKEDINKTMKKFNKYKGEDYLKDFSVSEIVNIAMYQYNNETYSYNIGKGKGNSSIVTQNILSFGIRNDNNYFTESLSKSSIVSVCNRAYYNDEDKVINTYEGKLPKLNEPSFDEESLCQYSEEEYYELMGKRMSNSFNYIVSSLTILKEYKKLDGDTYKISVELDPEIAVYDYVRQMKTISNLKDYPKFDYVTLTYRIDKSLKIKSLDVEEKYYAKTKLGIGSSVEATMHIDYYIGNLDIPLLSERLNYEVGE